MEAIKDFLTEFKDRITNPFFGSFLIAWIICNWQIPVVLLFYKQDDLFKYTKFTYIKAVESYLSVLHSVIFPLIAAFIYTFLYPYFKNLVKRFHAERNIELDAAILKKSADKGYVSIARHQEIEKELKEKVMQLTNFYESQTQIALQNETLKLSVAELELKNKEIVLELDDNKKKLSSTEQERKTFENKVRKMEGLFDNVSDFLKNSYNVLFRLPSGMKIRGEIKFENDKVEYLASSAVISKSLSNVPMSGNYQLSFSSPGRNREIAFAIINLETLTSYSFYIGYEVGSAKVLSGKVNGRLNVEFRVKE